MSHVNAFLVLCEELHFGRTAERLYVSGPSISQRIGELEQEVGGQLFQRTSRRVELTPLGARLRASLEPAHHQLIAALDDARAAARAPAGKLRLGFTQATDARVLDRLIEACERDHPQITVQAQEIALDRPFQALRDDEVDVLFNWIVVDLPGLSHGPPLHWSPRALMVSTDHPLADRDEVSIEDAADHLVPNFAYVNSTEAPLRDAIVPLATPRGRPLRRHSTRVRHVSEAVRLVARGQAVWPTVRSVRSIERYGPADGVKLLTIGDLEPLPLGLIWCTARTNARIRAVSAVGPSEAPDEGVTSANTVAHLRPSRVVGPGPTRRRASSRSLP